MGVSLGQLLERLRKERDLRVYELAEAIGVTPPTMSRKISGDIAISTAERTKLAGLFGMELGEFDDLWKKQDRAALGGIPVINRAPAGQVLDYNHDQGAGAEMHDAWQYIDRGLIGDPDAYAVVVVGDSMEPAVSDGDLCVFVPVIEDRKSRQPQPGQVVFIRYTQEAPRQGCCLCRWAPMEDGQWLLTKDNPKYKAMVVNPEHVARMGILLERRTRRV